MRGGLSAHKGQRSEEPWSMDITIGTKRAMYPASCGSTEGEGTKSPIRGGNVKKSFSVGSDI